MTSYIHTKKKYEKHKHSIYNSIFTKCIKEKYTKNSNYEKRKDEFTKC